jgi:hypothetical protein
LSYIRIDDRFPSHRKALAAGPYGRDLYVCGLAYCSLHLTDGVIPRTVLGTIVGPPSNYVGRGVYAWSNIVRQTAELLVDVGLWEVVEGVGYRVHDYHAWNKSASEISELRRIRAEAGTLGGRRSGRARVKQPASSGEAKGKHVVFEATNPASSASITPLPPEAPASQVSKKKYGLQPDGTYLLHDGMFNTCEKGKQGLCVKSEYLASMGPDATQCPEHGRR